MRAGLAITLTTGAWAGRFGQLMLRHGADTTSACPLTVGLRTTPAGTQLVAPTAYL